MFLPGFSCSKHEMTEEPLPSIFSTVGNRLKFIINFAPRPASSWNRHINKPSSPIHANAIIRR